MGTRGGGRARGPEFFLHLECFFRSSPLRNHRPLPRFPARSVDSFSSPLDPPSPFQVAILDHASRWRPLLPDTQPRRASEAARARAWAQEGGAVTFRRRPASGSRSSPGRTRKWRRRRGGSSGGEAGRRWLSRIGERVWDWGRGAGLNGLGSLAWTGRERPWPRQSCRGSTRSWLRSTRRYPSWAGIRGSPALRPRVALTCRDGGVPRREHARALHLSPSPPLPTITDLPPAAP